MATTHEIDSSAQSSASGTDKILGSARKNIDGSMSHARFFGTFVTLFLALVLIYASAFYVPAFLMSQKTLGLSTEAGKLPNHTALESGGILNKYAGAFMIRRGYFKAGQTLRLDHDLPPGAILKVSISRCSAPPVIEVFYCLDVEGEQVKIQTSGPSGRNFIVRKSGFYYFDDVVSGAGQSENDSYNVMWSRK